jgi:hypothetical protein
MNNNTKMIYSTAKDDIYYHVKKLNYIKGGGIIGSLIPTSYILLGHITKNKEIMNMSNLYKIKIPIISTGIGISIGYCFHNYFKE